MIVGANVMARGRASIRRLVAVVATGGVLLTAAACTTTMPGQTPVAVGVSASAEESAVLGLTGVANARDALAGAGLAPGRVFRSGSLCDATEADKALISSLLAGGTLIDLRTADTATSCPDPTLAGVAASRDPVDSDADFAGYVDDADRRASFGAALEQVQRSVSAQHSAWVHCSAGRSRTGWTVAVLLAILGAPIEEIYAEFERSPGASRASLKSGLAAVEARYGSAVSGGVTGPGMYAYARALGVADADIAALRAALRP